MTRGISLNEQQIANAARLRADGTSIRKIARILGVGVGTVHKYVRSLAISTDAKSRIRRESIGVWTEERRAAVGERTKRNWNRGCFDGRVQEMKGKAPSCWMAASLAYRKDELEIKSKLEFLYGCIFQKEFVGGVFFDFASEGLLIEHSFDYSHGVQDLTRRFRVAEAIGDVRKRVAFIDMSSGLIGNVRVARLLNLKVEIRDVVELATVARSTRATPNRLTEVDAVDGRQHVAR